MLMIALQDVSSTVAVIPAGRQFHEMDEERAELLVRQGVAKRVEEAGAVKVNLGGWDGLLWDNAEVCIMASGPSMTKEQAAAAMAWAGAGKRKTMVINTTFRLAPSADVLYACDARWWRLHLDEVKDSFAGALWSLDKDSANVDRSIRLIDSERKDGLGRTPGVIHQGMSSGYQAINLAYQAGARRIILLGFDCRSDGYGKAKMSHWHGDHPPSLNSTQPYQRWIELMAKLAADLKEDGVEVVNASPKSALQCFPKQDWRKVLA